MLWYNIVHTKAEGKHNALLEISVISKFAFIRVIAVGYEARAFGVSRGMMGQDAQEKCPSIHLFRVREVEGKADLTL